MGCSRPKYTTTKKLTVVLVAPPQLSDEEIRAAEAEATFTVQRALAAAVALYLCTSSLPP